MEATAEKNETKTTPKKNKNSTGKRLVQAKINGGDLFKTTVSEESWQRIVQYCAENGKHLSDTMQIVVTKLGKAKTYTHEEITNALPTKGKGIKYMEIPL